MKNDQRYLDSVASLINEENQANTVLIKGSSDYGVRRNKGKNGARFAPNVIVNTFKKLNNHYSNINGIHTFEVSSQTEEQIDFEKSIESKVKNISDILSKNYENVIHIGGGHDHAYPFLKAIEAIHKPKNIIILNIDAHCDTRVDTHKHSGTPFRDFDTSTNSNVHLFQLGIHKYANSTSTLSNLKNIKQEIIFKEDINSFDAINELKKICTKDSFIYLSLDADGLDQSVMSAVSAVNGNGLSIDQVTSLINDIKRIECSKAFGIYEYNPIFDNITNQNARALTHLMHHWLI